MEHCELHPEQSIDSPLGIVCPACAASKPPTAYKNPPPEGGFLKRPLIEITRTKGIETQLTRIADCLEAILEEAYSRYMTPPKGDTSGPEPQVMYTDQDKFDIEEMVERVKEEEEG